MKKSIVIAGSLAQKPGRGGHTWVFLQWILGFRKLGWDVLFLDRLEPEMCVGDTGAPAPLARSWNVWYFMNVMRFLQDEEILAAAPQRVLLDIDPGFGQMWQALGQYDTFRGHDAYVTIAENMGRPDCAIPTCGLGWITTRQP